MDFLAEPTHLLFLVIVLVLLFGSTRLPRLARSLREARDEFTKASDEKPKDKPASEAPVSQPPASEPRSDDPPPGGP